MKYDSTVSNTIRDHVGHKALYMLGAKNLVARPNALSFRIRGSRKVNYISIELNAMDLYDVEFGKVWGTKYTVVNTVENIYFDMLRPLIEENTGLYTSL